MISELSIIVTLVSIWLSLFWALLTLSSATHFWLKHSRFDVDLSPLEEYPMISVVVPAHNEEVVIAKTMRAILEMNYPKEAMEVLLFADNCSDATFSEMERVKADVKYKGHTIRLIERQGTGGKAGVLNDALKLAKGDYIAVYDADAMPEANALYFLVKKILENKDDYVAAFGRNKTRNAKQNLLTRFINQEIITTQRVQHVGSWHLFKIGRIPGTNFLIEKAFVESIGGWSSGALTEDTDISFKIMEKGKLIALAYNSEAFQQEPETLKTYYMQRKRWAKGNYEVVFKNICHLFRPSNWRVKLEVVYYTCTFFWFNAAIVLSNIIFASNLIALVVRQFNDEVTLPFTFNGSNLYLEQMLFFNWLLMILIYLLQIHLAMATQFGQATSRKLWIALLAYFTYSQLFIIVSIDALISLCLDKLLQRDGTKWVKTKRFSG